MLVYILCVSCHPINPASFGGPRGLQRLPQGGHLMVMESLLVGEAPTVCLTVLHIKYISPSAIVKCFSILGESADATVTIPPQIDFGVPPDVVKCWIDSGYDVAQCDLRIREQLLVDGGW